MNTYQNILVVIDPSTDEQKALKRAIALATNINTVNHTKVTIHAFLSIFDFSYEMTTILSGDERNSMRQSVIKDKERWLKNIIQSLNVDIDIQCQV
ncbi:MAG: universal stress protein UspE, partial [Colwellia sp.]